MESKENMFLIDLSALSLTEEQRTEIKSALEKAVTSVLAKFPLPKGKITLVPLEKPKDAGSGKGVYMGYRGDFH